jgi:hypothetical protein
MREQLYVGLLSHMQRLMLGRLSGLLGHVQGLMLG